MLTGDLLRANVTRASVTPRFVDPDDPGLLETARALAAAFEMHVGRSRGELKTALEGRAQGGDRVRLERSPKLRSADATVIAVQYHEGRKAVAVRFTQGPCEWVTQP